MNKSEERLRHQLEVQSIQIEEFLTRHDVPAEVAGGTVRSRWVNFDLQTQISAGLEKLRVLRHELAATLGASDVSITRNDDRLRIAVKQPKTHAVDLLDLLDAIPELSAMTAALGLDAEDRPVLLNLLADDIINILVAGGPEAGKTALLRTLALSLAIRNRQSQMQLAIFDVGLENDPIPQKISLYPLNYLPHVMFPVVETLEEAAEALAFLASEAKYRIEQEINWPLLVVVVDNVDQLVEIGGEPVGEPLTYLLEEGVQAGMRVILGVSHTDGKSIGPILKNNMPVRLVGQVADAAVARAITGVADSQAEYLLGQGDFMAVSNGMLLPFQSAYISDYDLHLVLDQMHRQNNPIMIAYPMTVRPSLEDSEEDLDQLQIFQFNSHNRRANLVLPAENEPDTETANWSIEAKWEESQESEDEWFEDGQEEDFPIDVWVSTDRQPKDKDEATDWNEDEIAFDWE